MSPTSKKPPPAPLPRLLAARYHLTALLTATPTATVHAARDLRLHRPVAVELVRPEHAATELERRRLFRGSVLAATIDHPHVMPLVDFGEERGADGEALVFRVTPPRRGRTLRGLLSAGALGWRTAASLGRQLLAGLGAVHGRGGLHGAIRPEACLVRRVDGREHLRLLEVGLPWVAPAAPSPSPSSSSSAAADERVDVRSDLFAVGALLHELLTGRAIETRTDPGASGWPTTIVARPGIEPVPKDIIAIVARSLASAPAERFESASAFAASLAAALGEATSASATTTRSPASPCTPACAAARASLAAWTRFEYDLARAEARAAALEDGAWSPLRLLMSFLPEGGDAG